MLKFKHTIFSDEVIIDAPVEQVWAILLDIERYPEWNPFTYRIGTPRCPDRRLRVGTPVDLHVRMTKRGDKLQQEWVEIIDPPHTLAWGMTMGARVLLKALREQHLLVVNASQCRYQTSDAFAGILTPLVVALFGDDIRNGFNAVAYALKQRAESVSV